MAAQALAAREAEGGILARREGVDGRDLLPECARSVHDRRRGAEELVRVRVPGKIVNQVRTDG